MRVKAYIYKYAFHQSAISQRFYPTSIDLKTFGIFHKWLDGGHSYIPGNKSALRHTSQG